MLQKGACSDRQHSASSPAHASLTAMLPNYSKKLPRSPSPGQPSNYQRHKPSPRYDWHPSGPSGSKRWQAGAPPAPSRSPRRALRSGCGPARPAGPCRSANRRSICWSDIIAINSMRLQAVRPLLTVWALRGPQLVCIQPCCQHAGYGTSQYSRAELTSRGGASAASARPPASGWCSLQPFKHCAQVLL